MAMGKPIIASRLEQIGDILVHQETGYLVEPGNIKMLSEAINYLIHDEGLREKLSSSTRKMVIKMYTWDRHVETILNKLSGND